MRHTIFCATGLQACQARVPDGPHDRYDRSGTVYFGLSYGPEVIGTARLITGAGVSDLPTGTLLPRLASTPPVLPGCRYSEASQFGILPQYQQEATLAELARLRLTGDIVAASVELGYDYFLLTLRGVMFGALHWVPWNLASPFYYPPEAGGPLRPEPMWPATVNLHELAQATAWLRPAQFRMMFPHPPTWLDLGQVRPRWQLAAKAARNQQLVLAAQRAWRSGSPLPRLAPLQ